MFAIVQAAFDKGQLPSTKGGLVILDDFAYEWAQINYYDFFDTGQDVADFVVKAHFKWENASASPDPSGCGFAFRIQSNGDHYVSFLDQKSTWVGHWNSSARQFRYLGKTSGQGSPEFPNPAEADFALVVYEGHLYSYVNGEYMAEYTIFSQLGKLESGRLAYTIVSGTNKDFGTRCEMTNVALWRVTP